MKIKKAKPEDSRLLAEMNHHLIRDSGHRNPMNVTQLTHRMRGWIKGEYKVCFFEVGGKTIGYCVYRPGKEFLYIRQFFIQRQLRRKGFGRKAMKLLLGQTWKKHSLIRLDVLVNNSAAIRFWRSVGFKDYCLTLERKNL